MAYNPNLYNPYAQTQPTQMWQYQPTQTVNGMQPINGLVSVTGIEGARAYQMPPNSSMPLFDKDNDVLYVKTTDAAGYPTLKRFRFEPMEDDSTQKPEYVTKEDFDALAKKVEGLTPKTRTRKAAADAE